MRGVIEVVMKLVVMVVFHGSEQFEANDSSKLCHKTAPILRKCVLWVQVGGISRI